jgi:hypothetical protein
MILTLFSIPAVFSLKHPGSASGQANLLVEGRSEKTIMLPGKSGKRFYTEHGGIKLEADGNRIRVAESACPGGRCIETGWIEDPSQVIVCAPLGILVSIVGDSCDAFTY